MKRTDQSSSSKFVHPVASVVSRNGRGNMSTNSLRVRYLNTIGDKTSIVIFVEITVLKTIFESVPKTHKKYFRMFKDSLKIPKG